MTLLLVLVVSAIFNGLMLLCYLNITSGAIFSSQAKASHSLSLQDRWREKQILCKKASRRNHFCDHLLYALQMVNTNKIYIFRENDKNLSQVVGCKSIILVLYLLEEYGKEPCWGFTPASSQVPCSCSLTPPPAGSGTESEE